MKCTWMNNLIATCFVLVRCFFHMDEQCVEKNQFNNHLLVKMILCVDEFLKNQFNNYLLVEMVLLVDEFFPVYYY